MVKNRGESSYSERKKILEPLDEVGLKGFHLKTWLVSGMGFFTDAYDLFIIGMVIAMLAGPWGLTKFQEGLLGSTSLIAAVFGAFIFGKLLDVYGRKAIYGIELIILIAGAVLSALSTNINQLMLWRFVLGIGIGGDYATSAIIMSEYSNRKDRGKLVSMVFSMQSLGLLVGPLITMGLLSTSLSIGMDWRILLLLGAIPPLFVIYYRRKIAETPRFALGVNGDVHTARQTVMTLTDTETIPKVDGKNVAIKQSPWMLLTNIRYLLLVIGTALSWFLLDWAFYGNSISSSAIMASVAGKGASLYTTALYTFIIFAVFAFPGYWIATALMDKIGRKFIQVLGFLVMGISYMMLAFIPAIMSSIIPFMAVYGISYFFIEFGPNVTTFVYPSEVFPVNVRGIGDGMAAGAGKFGAFLGTLLFPVLLIMIHLNGLFAFLGIISLIGVVETIILLPEPKHKSLEEASGEHLLEQPSEILNMEDELS